MIEFTTRKLIKPEDLNPQKTLFGGTLLRWIDEQAGIYAMLKLQTKSVVTKFMSEIDFVSSAFNGDVIEIGLSAISAGTTSVSFLCEVRNLFTQETIITIDTIVLVHVDNHGKPQPHNKTLEQIRGS